MQFHPELTSDTLAGWLAADGEEEVRAAGFDPEALVAATLVREGEARERSHRLVDGFLEHVATVVTCIRTVRSSPTRPTAWNYPGGR